MASVRSIAATPIVGAFGTAARPQQVRAGDVLLACHTADDADNSGLVISGGGIWGLITLRAGSGWGGTRIHARYATTSEPDEYDIFTTGGEFPDPDSTVIIMAIRAGTLDGIVFASANGHVAPGLDPSSSSGLEIRYGTGAIPFEDVGAETSWAQIPGYDGLDIQSREWTSASIAVRPIFSNAPLDTLDMDPTPVPQVSQAFTIFIPSATGSGTVPTPPTFPAGTPGLGRARMRHTVHDALTGEYRGDVVISGAQLGRRFGEPAPFQGTIPLPSKREADRIAEIIPRDPDDTSGGPGRVVIHSWRSGVLWGINWCHGTVIERPEGQGVGMQLVGASLDSYLYQVSIEDDLEFEDDEFEVLRSLVTEMQSTPGSSMGFGLTEGSSGTVRLLEAGPADNKTYGQTIADFARGQFEWLFDPIVSDGAIIRRLVQGAPTISNADSEHVFQEGADITSWREERSALNRPNRIGVIGGTPQQTDATEDSTAVRSELVETAAVAAGFPIIDRRFQHPLQSTDQSTLDAYAQYWADKIAGAGSVWQFGVILGETSTFGPNSLGDYARFVMSNPWHARTAAGASGRNVRQRVIGWTLTPADRGTRGKDRLQLVTEQTEVPDS